jgi:CBS domain-containing protein
MASKQIRRLPVVEGGKVVGMLSLSDIARAAAVPGRAARETAEVVQTLGSIVQPRTTGRPATEASGAAPTHMRH